MNKEDKKLKVIELMNYLQALILRGIDSEVTGDLTPLELITTSIQVLYEKTVRIELERQAKIGVDVVSKIQSEEQEAFTNAIVLPFVPKKPLDN